VTTEGESPPDKKAVGPRQESRPATSTTTKIMVPQPADIFTAPGMGTRRSRRWYRHTVEHRKVCFALDAILPRTPEPVEPSRFGLTEDEIRRHANDLYRAGWAVEEIRVVLDIDPVTE
jgi:hypothetical protein